MAKHKNSFRQIILVAVLFCTAILLAMIFITPPSVSADRTASANTEAVPAVALSADEPPSQTQRDSLSTSAGRTANANAELRPEPVERNVLPIDRLTQRDTVVNHLVQTGRLPDYYIDKRSARDKGWNAQRGNLCDVLPGKAIGGDRFGNRERQLPHRSGRIWYEADINYGCGRRGADRLVYSNDGLIYITTDHYKSFHQLRGEQ